MSSYPYNYANQHQYSYPNSRQNTHHSLHPSTHNSANNNMRYTSTSQITQPTIPSQQIPVIYYTPRQAQQDHPSKRSTRRRYSFQSSSSEEDEKPIERRVLKPTTRSIKPKQGSRPKSKRPITPSRRRPSGKQRSPSPSSSSSEEVSDDNESSDKSSYRQQPHKSNQTPRSNVEYQHTSLPPHNSHYSQTTQYNSSQPAQCYSIPHRTNARESYNSSGYPIHHSTFDERFPIVDRPYPLAGQYPLSGRKKEGGSVKRFVKECLTEMRDEKLKTLGGKLEKAQGEFWGDTVPKYVVRKVVGRELGRWDDIVRVSGEGR